MNHVEVRPLEPADRPTVRAQHLEAFGPEHALGEVVLTNLFVHERATNLVATLDGEVVGFVSSLHGMRDLARILTIHVADHARGHGIAKRLLAALCVHLQARGVRSVSLEVHVDNDAAIALYRSAGFEIVERDPEAYPRRDPPDGLVMARALAAPANASRPMQ